MEFTKGDKIAYRTISSGTVLGVVTETGCDFDGEWIRYRVTGRRSGPAYPYGEQYYCSVPTAFMRKRGE